ncbi:MAG TPA: hypothetical protein VGJ92_10955 [Methanocella sp.]
MTMGKQLFNYGGIGLVFGAAIGGIAAVVLYGLTMNSTFFLFAGAGAGLGLVAGAVLDLNQSRQAKK